jgi:hypothetical protein
MINWDDEQKTMTAMIRVEAFKIAAEATKSFDPNDKFTTSYQRENRFFSMAERIEKAILEAL